MNQTNHNETDFNQVNPRDIHKGDILWESGQYGSIQFEVLNEPTHVDGKWEWKARTTKHGVVDYLITDGMEHYGPEIYRNVVYAFGIEPLEDTDEEELTPLDNWFNEYVMVSQTGRQTEAVHSLIQLMAQDRENAFFHGLTQGRKEGHDDEE